MPAGDEPGLEFNKEIEFVISEIKKNNKLDKFLNDAIKELPEYNKKTTQLSDLEALLKENGSFADRDWAGLLDSFERSDSFTSLETDQEKAKALYDWISA